MNFVLIDTFHKHLEQGMNIIERDSREAHYSKDKITYRKLIGDIIEAIQGNEQFVVDLSEAHSYFPDRFMIPKGKPEGMSFKMYFFIHLPNPAAHGYKNLINFNNEYPMGFPLDRPLSDERIFFNVPNAMMKSVKIYHEKSQEFGH